MTYIVAEIEVPSSSSAGYKLIDAAVKAGADAVKVQYYRAEDLVDKSSEWFEHYHANEMSWKLLVRLSHYAKTVKIDFGVSVFSPEQVIDVEPYCDYLKIASPEAMDFALIDSCVATKKRVMVSVSSSLAEPLRTTLLERYEDKVEFLWCPSGYPADRPKYRHTTINMNGLSDHSCGTYLIYIYGVDMPEIIEKHMGYKDNTEPWVMHPTHFAEWVKQVRAERVTATPLRLWKRFDEKGNYVRMESDQPEIREAEELLQWHETEQLSLFDPIPTAPPERNLAGAIIDTQLEVLLRDYSWEEIERAIERIKRG